MQRARSRAGFVRLPLGSRRAAGVASAADLLLLPRCSSHRAAHLAAGVGAAVHLPLGDSNQLLVGNLGKRRRPGAGSSDRRYAFKIRGLLAVPAAVAAQWRTSVVATTAAAGGTRNGSPAPRLKRPGARQAPCHWQPLLQMGGGIRMPTWVRVMRTTGLGWPSSSRGRLLRRTVAAWGR